jgi:glycosyltransferase involved in cell wall biosynthesis
MSYSSGIGEARGERFGRARKPTAPEILELNSDGDLRKRLGEAAKTTVLERYTAEKVVGQYLDIYDKIATS